VRRCVS